jgi:aminoglycoside phosphotransferase family enzyme
LSGPVVRVHTANAVVFLAGPDAYKVKRAVKFPFMDLSTLDKRRRACQAEIAVNCADAPGVYLAALPITRKGETLEIGGKFEPVEWLTHMRRFDEHATLDRAAAQDGRSDAVVDKLALTIRRSHARAPLEMGRNARMLSRPTSSRTKRRLLSGPIFSMGRRPAS